jgi:hypothetical protein
VLLFYPMGLQPGSGIIATSHVIQLAVPARSAEVQHGARPLSAWDRSGIVASRSVGIRGEVAERVEECIRLADEQAVSP